MLRRELRESDVFSDGQVEVAGIEQRKRSIIRPGHIGHLFSPLDWEHASPALAAILRHLPLLSIVLYREGVLRQQSLRDEGSEEGGVRLTV